MVQTVEDIAEKLSEGKVQSVGFVTVSITGERKAIYIPSEFFAKHVKEGKGFDGSSVKGFRRIVESDMLLMPDLNSFFISPFQGDSAYVMCDVYDLKGKPFKGDSRRILKKQVARARSMGFEPFMGPELEFFLLRGGQPHDEGAYFTDATKEGHEFREKLSSAMNKAGMQWILHHHEVAEGQHEVNFMHADPVTTADNAVKVKYLARRIAQDMGLVVTYMPKFRAGINGSGMHTHQSLRKKDKNAFSDGNGGLSPIGRQYAAGILAHLPEMTAVLNPIPTSYKRLIPGYEAPNLICWGSTNRSSAARVPYGEARVELRSADPTTNPYLAFAVMLGAGTDGIRRRMKIPPEMRDNAFELSDEERQRRGVGTSPGSLDEALDLTEKSAFVRGVLGPWTFDRFIEVGRKEAAAYREAVTIQVSGWEIDRYLHR